ncbi:LLM class flavin-dependent oxidoreductase [Frankia sp. QA3]|uniref:LLM class flavin-dependent oxidoreductase n=1 Tax=Frankia sp. QA3 TaxID=710111 RepID=UPI000269BCAA|nr:LLM class flavin-dependent oxidoreductase [Frankia sp. QA3]EIV91776.1 flavin-dependent oxidoreductase, F420-dependent methylene-tetrahydromethanopterin reductase [Frankia sp. QA3]
MELGINTLGGVSADRRTGATPTEHERLASIVAQGVLAERLGFEAFSVGEHHGDRHFVTSAPPVILAAIAAQTERVRLMTGVTLLPLLDPVRVAEDYATLDVISGGRVEIVAGKGNFASASRLLIGQDDPDRGALLREHLDLLLEILRTGHIPAWPATSSPAPSRPAPSRPALSDAHVTPRPVQPQLPVWLGATRNVDSVELAASKGLPVLVAGFRAGTYADFADHYREAFAAAGHDPRQARVASLSTVVVDHDEARVRREYRAYWEQTVNAAAQRNQGLRQDNRAQRLLDQGFDDLTGPAGQILVGTPEYVAERLIGMHQDLRHDLHFLQIDNGLGPAGTEEIMHLIAEEVAPLVRKETALSAA